MDKLLLLFFIVILLVVLTIILFKKGEKFTEIIKLDSDFYIPNRNNVIDFKQKSVNSHRICVYDDTDPNNVDIECINANELIPILELPVQRKTEVCIDDICLNKSDIEVLNGSRSFKLQSKDSSTSSMNNKCLYQGNTQSHVCGSEEEIANISTINHGECTSNPLRLVLREGLNKDSDLNRRDLRQSVVSSEDKELSHH